MTKRSYEATNLTNDQYDGYDDDSDDISVSGKVQSPWKRAGAGGK